MTAEEVDSSRIEHQKAFYEFLRHVMTLDTGALVLIATLLEKVFPNPAGRAAAGLSVVLLLVSLLCGGVAYLVLLANGPRVGAERMGSSDRNVYAYSATGMFAAFFGGIGSLACFFAINWFR